MSRERPKPQVVAILLALVEERLGLHYGLADEPIFVDRLLARMEEAGFETALDYYYFLRYDGAAAAELDALADSLVVGETYLFRELDSVRAGVRHVVARAVRERGRARVWSAGCATGEEPVSFAIALAEAGLLEATEIIATDVSPRALHRAREGVYGARSLRQLPRALGGTAEANDLHARALADLARTALTFEAGSARVTPRFSERIDYRSVNLLDAQAIEALGAFDLVLCRNVLIYFADETVRRVVASLANALEPRGRLVVGASESLLRFGTVLRCEERDGAFLYGKEDVA